MKINTQLVHVGVGSDAKTGAITTPIYQSATFRHPALGQSTGFDYSRTQNPTRKVLEEAIAVLEGGSDGFAFASGMAAITAVLMLFKTDDHIVVVEDCYGGTYRILDKVFTNFGLKVSFVDATCLDEIENSLTPSTRCILIETPTNPLMKIVDIRAIVKMAKKKDIYVVVDNTFLTPYLQRPLELGADLVVHSATKYLAGHNDVICGLVVSRNKQLGERIRFIQNSTGGILGPNDSWLLIRGMKTLALRMDKHCQNAQALAEWLQKQEQVETVYYPGLPQHPGKHIQEQQATGYGGMLSFTVRDSRLAPHILKRVKLLQFAESLGGVESLITFPAVQTHADIPPEVRNRLGITDCLLRVSVGIEDIDDIIADFEQAFAD
ncbi:cystathionine gamma-synthase [Anaerosporomusa subterranea]|uniref:Cystathionine gamma-synthase n=1 Tax=Anaerosporomusa subterranea TaxID=1794912 RepID=A0A154BM68_ANASB|nr:PLP-dependent aspartate aminotransferase family protein [Anaerosporomusa subterranea]KYZ74940.1 cystathionine gamma-synthase [Anaerosporomusa subterranea]